MLRIHARRTPSIQNMVHFYSCDTEEASLIRVEALKISGWLNYLRPQQKISLPFFS